MTKKKKRSSHPFLQSAFFTQCVAFFLRLFVSMIASTLRVRIKGNEKIEKLLQDPSRPPLIIALWHNNLFLLPHLYRKVCKKEKATVLISKSRDGNIPSRLATSFKNIEVIRVGHLTRHEALKHFVNELLKGKIGVITPDGPKGPCYSVKPGILFAAKKSNALIIPLSWEASNVRKLRTWDKFKIPMPFSTLTASYGDPISANEEELKKALS